VKLVRDQLLRVLEGYGVERVDATGAVFDPRQHDAVGVVEVTDERRIDRVIEQWQPGYRLGQRVLRPARVRVGRPAAA
jgi:molecular chaperone GrpE (heat shock protein)